jgi:hypothetical protein
VELQDIYLETRPEHIAYIKFIFESYEKDEVPLIEIERPADMGDDWFMTELAAELP